MNLIIGGPHDGQRIKIPQSAWDKLFLRNVGGEESVYRPHYLIDGDRNEHIVFAYEGINVIEELIKKYPSNEQD